jgi:CubicO group peptidase (beta-lactamase class C family)
MVVLLLAAPPPQAIDLIPPDVRENVAQRVEQGECVGLVVGVVEPQGTTTLCRGRMAADAERLVGEDTLFEIGSITKVFTAILLADMAERGLVGLDDPVGKLLPPKSVMPTRDGKQITLRHLATHRSGLPRMPENFTQTDEGNPYADYGEDDALQFLATYELPREIGSQYEYSNFGAGLLGLALSRRAGMSYAALVHERISAPLGLDDTCIELSAEQRSRLARGHVGTAPVKNWDFDALAGAGALRSTARDMLRFLRANLQLDETSLAPALQATHRERFETGQPETFVGLGWHMRTKNERTIIWHNGGTGGYRSFCGFDPARKRGVVVLCNSTAEIDDIGFHLLEPAFELKPVRPVVTVPVSTLDRYVGYYELQPGLVFHITREEAQLFAQLTGQAKFPVYPESETEFFFKVVEARLSFVAGAGGAIDHVVLHQNGDRKARRLASYQPPVHAEVPVDPTILARYVGQYELAPGMRFDVRLDGEHLAVKLGNQPRFPVFAESETKFFYKVIEAQITFNLDGAGKVTSLILHQSGADQTAKKIE